MHHALDVSFNILAVQIAFQKCQAAFLGNQFAPHAAIRSRVQFFIVEGQIAFIAFLAGNPFSSMVKLTVRPHHHARTLTGVAGN